MKDCSGPSKVVAVAGSSGGLGKHIVKSLVEAGLTVVALMRRDVPDYIDSLRLSVPADHLSVARLSFPSPSDPPSLHTSCVSSLAAVLASRTVDTVVSAMDGYDARLYVAEEALYDAAVMSGTVRRVSPSAFTAPLETAKCIRAYEPKIKMFDKAAAGPISYTEFATGLFLNYLGFGSPKSEAAIAKGQLGALGYLLPIPFLLEPSKGSKSPGEPYSPDSVASSTFTTASSTGNSSPHPADPESETNAPVQLNAGLSLPSVRLPSSPSGPLHLTIPGSASVPVVFTSIDDIAEAVVRCCMWDGRWERRTGWVKGCGRTYGQVKGAIEHARGVPLPSTVVPLATLQSRLSDLPKDASPTETFFDELMVFIASGGFDYALDEESLFFEGRKDEVATGKAGREAEDWMDVERFVQEWWSPVEG